MSEPLKPYLYAPSEREQRAFVIALYERGYRYMGYKTLDECMRMWMVCSWMEYPYVYVYPTTKGMSGSVSADTLGMCRVNSLAHFLAYLDRHFPAQPARPVLA